MSPTLTCERFTLTIDQYPISEPVISVSVESDLPPGTEIGISCWRTYRTMDNDERCWTNINQVVPLLPLCDGELNGARWQFNIDEGDQSALDLFNEINRRFGSGIRGTVSEKCQLQAIVGAKQLLRVFGTGNKHLSGPMVVDSGGIKVVSAKTEFIYPINREYSPTWS